MKIDNLKYYNPNKLYNKGEILIHHRFGSGTILQSTDSAIKVFFPDTGFKTLVHNRSTEDINIVIEHE